jgi:hypothetical protein
MLQFLKDKSKRQAAMQQSLFSNPAIRNAEGSTM